MRIDFHVHSKYSKRPSQWILQKLGSPESFSEPFQIYNIAKKKGMSLVTISDHNSIDGALEIAHLPDTFVSEEVTSYFPDDGCKIHVLAINITENQHQDIQKIRKNVFELIEYLNHENIFHVLAHPLYSINNLLTVEHFEKFLLLFKNFEMNGTRDGQINQHLKQVLSKLQPEDIGRLTEKHKIYPNYPDPWKKNVVGGSDDHGSLNIARTYTEIKGAHDLTFALKSIECGNSNVVFSASTPKTMAHNLYGIAYQFYRKKFNLKKYVGNDILLRFLDQSLRTDSKEENGFMNKLYCLWQYKKQRKEKSNFPETLLGLLRKETQKLIHDNPRLMSIAEGKKTNSNAPEKEWFNFVNQLSNSVLLHFADHLMDNISGANVFNIFHTIGSAGGLYTLLAPYFICYSLFKNDRRFGKKILEGCFKDVGFNRNKDVIKVAHFTDTFYDVNGVALSLQQQIQVAIRTHKNLTILTCDSENRSKRKGIQNFKPIGVYELPEYPELKFYYPPLLEMLNYCYEQKFTHIHSATPGPIGMAALAIAKILHLPIYGTYHTALPQYAQILTGDDTIEDIMWKFMLWYYDHMNFIYVPSRNTGEELIEKGIDSNKIKIFPRGIDIDRFNPSKRNGYLTEHYQIKETIKLLYVGRVSKEKNLHLLVYVLKTLSQKVKNIHLVVVGDGPYLDEMKEQLRGMPCTFTGYLEGEALSFVYASSDIFVFPSTTDTFGNVVLEAQASGIPVIVTDKGGPHENIIEDQTGWVVKADDPEDLLDAIQRMIQEPQLIRKMGKSARDYMESRSFDGAFIKTWKMYQEGYDTQKIRVARV
ncbi:MAG: glycosyltransferase [Desulfobacterales bacterium]|jgi:glycosyltransferase involved in cell wall biosynthesis